MNCNRLKLENKIKLIEMLFTRSNDYIEWLDNEALFILETFAINFFDAFNLVMHREMTANNKSYYPTAYNIDSCEVDSITELASGDFYFRGTIEFSGEEEAFQLSGNVKDFKIKDMDALNMMDNTEVILVTDYKIVDNVKTVKTKSSKGISSKYTYKFGESI